MEKHRQTSVFFLSACLNYGALWQPTGGKFATGINHTSSSGGKICPRVVDTGGKFATGVVDTGGKFATGVVDTGGKFATGVIDTGGAP